MKCRIAPLLTLLAALAAGGGPAAAAALPVEELVLDNGMRFLLLPRPGMPTVEAGWVVDAGSAADGEGAAGAHHLIEHMMFKGSRTIGAVDLESELYVLGRLDEVAARLAALRPPGERRKDDLRRAELEAERRRLRGRARELTRLGAFSFEYSRAGATRLDANTAEDMTLYYVTLPAEKVELWFWLESDRLGAPVFRELEPEKGVIAEERRLRVASTPTGAADEAFDRAFWRGTPYAGSALGRDAELAGMDRPRLRRLFEREYRPERLTAVLVGAFDPAAVRRLAPAYFGRLPRAAAEDVRGEPPVAPDRRAEERLHLECECAAQVVIRYPTVPFGHPDQFDLQALAGLLNGRAGRLHRELVLGREIAFAAFAQQLPLRRAGAFTVRLEAKGGTPLAELVAAWDGEVARLTAAPPPADELRRAQRRLATEHLELLKDPHFLMRRLLVYAGLGDWRPLARWPELVAATAPADVQAAAGRYLRPERRLVGFYEPAAEAP
ncbi:MAG: insulinase family protein [Acidobacteriota bacterium]|nr:insulinase family protein [Acidobacteriota bacterium]MDH3525077.1 insulinase family protein [Acidobacteriota bacterium]